MAQRVVAGLGASDDATVFSAGRSSAAGAALANGVASHILELDDVHKGSTLHAAAPVIPAALAVAEREHASGRAFLLAVTLGYDAALRVGEAVNPDHYRFLHPDRHGGDVRRRGRRRTPARDSMPSECSTRSAPRARRPPACGSSTPTAR